MDWERVETLGAREMGVCVTQYSCRLIVKAESHDGRLVGYRPFVQHCRIWLVDGRLSFVIGEARADCKVGI